MADIIKAELMPLPSPRVAVSIRRASLDDIPAMDCLQKANSKSLGFFTRGQFEGYVSKYLTLVAVGESGTVVGYIAGTDRYLKRDELGAVFQLCIDPSARRGLIGAALLQAMFDHSAYGCRLYCCWCAQDLEANHFWEAMGFVPLAYRAGAVRGRGKRQVARGKSEGQNESSCLSGGPASARASYLVPSARIHIFWQKRIRANDVSTPWWFPSKTSGGALGDERIVLPIPPGMRWHDALPVLMPDAAIEQQKVIPDGRSKAGRVAAVKMKPPTPRENLNTFHFRPISPPIETPANAAIDVRRPTRRVRQKSDPTLVAKARELRDRWLEHLNTSEGEALPLGNSKYRVNRLPPGKDRVNAIDAAAMKFKQLAA